MIFKDKVAQWLKGHPQAIEFVLTVHEIAELWDDLIDKDPASDERVNNAFYMALITLPRNAFYREHFGLLNPLLESAIFDWWTANEYEQAKTPEKLKHAWALRFSPFALTVMSARIIGGVEWASMVNSEFRAMGEPWAAYAAEHGVKDGVD